MRLVIVGGGPAGLLAARSLSAMGTVTVIDPVLAQSPLMRPQSVHAHRLPPAVWDRLERLAPGLLGELQQRGVPMAPVGATSLDGEPGGAAVPWPTRTSLDAALLACCRDAVDALHPARVVRCVYQDGQWHLTLRDGTALEADTLVDASGSFRVSLAGIAACVGGPVPLDEGPASGGYATVQLHGVALPADRIGHRMQDAASGVRALLLQEQAGSCRLTVQFPHGTPLPRSPADLLAVLSALEDTRLHALAADAGIPGTVSTWAPQRPTRIALEELNGVPDGWLPIGDALLITPPHFGQGITQIVQQIERVRAGLAAGHTVPQLRDALSQWASWRWLEATFMDGLSGLSL